MVNGLESEKGRARKEPREGSFVAQSATTKTIPCNISCRGTLNSCAFPNANASSITGESDRARRSTEAMGNNSNPADFYLRSIVRGTATGNENSRSIAR